MSQNDVVQNGLSSTSNFIRIFETLPTSLASFQSTLFSIDDPLPGPWCRNTDGESSHAVSR